MTMLTVPGPGVYGLVQPDGELLLWRYRGRDSKRSWPIWDAPAMPVGKAVTMRGEDDRDVVLDAGCWILPTNSVASIRGVPQGVPRRHWRPVWFGAVGTTNGGIVNWLAVLHAEVDTRVWWTDARSRARDRRAFYMPAMPRDHLVTLVRDLEASSASGVKETRKQPIGVWIRRVWDVIERRERGETFGVLP